MPSTPYSSYTKALREPSYFLWELRGGRGKDFAAKFRSKASIGVQRGRGELIYDHAIPFRYLQEELLSLTEPSPKAVSEILERHCVAVLLTKAEDAQLAKARLARHMPDDWDGSDVLARYAAVGIDVISNT